VADLNKRLQEAAAQGQFVMLDFYADWCVSCKEMERYTFKDEGVIDALRPILLLKADVTDNSEANAELMKHFGLIGPPATLFFNPEGEELKSLRVIGYMEADAFQAHVRKVMPR
jgi:thiol:disulfide interchange protein DsbD